MSTKGGAVGSSRGLPGAPAGELGQSFSTICISMSKEVGVSMGIPPAPPSSHRSHCSRTHAPVFVFHTGGLAKVPPGGLVGPSRSHIRTSTEI